jgi:hypothetical protein
LKSRIRGPSHLTTVQLLAGPQNKLETLVRKFGEEGAARRIGCAWSTVVRLRDDGSAPVKTVERVQRKLEELADG